jgi:DNA-binding MarR family transcriptional regulator
MKLDDLAGYLLGSTYHSMLALVQRKLQQANIPLTSEQAKVLNLVFLHPGINQMSIAKLLRKDKPGVTRLVEGLERSYLILRKEDALDRRNRKLFLTSDGERVREQMLPVIKEMHEILYRGLNEKQVEEFKSLVMSVRENVQKELNEDL